MIKKTLVYFLVLCLFNCNKTDYSYIPNQTTPVSRELNDIEIKEWSYKDILDDSIPGISLHKSLNTVLKRKTGEKVVIAIIDDGLDINHSDLKNKIWINSDEIAGNNIDDDNNGYIDDINGWNFSGLKNGDSNKFRHYDYVRIVKAYDSIFKDKTVEDINSFDSLKFKRYKTAKRFLGYELENINGEIEYANNIYKWKNQSKQILKDHFNLNNFDLKTLDSLKNLSLKDSILQKNIKKLSGFITHGFTDDYIEAQKLKSNNALLKQLNLDFNEREVIGDNPNDIDDRDYGNANVSVDINFYPHATIVAGILTKHTPQLEIMPLAIPGFGSKHDKDIALAIRYAVDNGAKVINMSFGKNFSLQKEFVDDAIKYAEKNNVLIVTSAGNDYHDMDHPRKFNYPDDRDSSGKEFVSNFIKVGGTTFSANENFMYEYSNYGQKNVDIFAPAEKIYTTFPDNEYKYDTGTSLASALTSQVAGLLYSYYPSLTASQVKQILLESGVEYSFDVKMPSMEDEERALPFNSLSKSGKVVNAYNALIMADSISKN